MDQALTRDPLPEAPPHAAERDEQNRVPIVRARVARAELDRPAELPLGADEIVGVAKGHASAVRVSGSMLSSATARRAIIRAVSSVGWNGA